jgi:hypothetical protein
VTTDPRYPIGPFASDPESSEASRRAHVDGIAALPAAMRRAVSGLGPAQLDTPYRPGGWTVRQVVHHVPDSHLNSYVRFKLALTEDAPTIRPYDEAAWARLPDTALEPVETSLALLESLHRRWVTLLRALPPEAFSRAFVHPESGATTLERAVALYDWHGRHHVAHIEALREREGWTAR